MNKNSKNHSTTYQRRIKGIEKASGDKWWVKKYLLNSFGISRSAIKNNED